MQQILFPRDMYEIFNYTENFVNPKSKRQQKRMDLEVGVEEEAEEDEEERA